MLAVMKKLTYDDEYNFENEVREDEAMFVVLIVSGGPQGEDEAMFVVLIVSGGPQGEDEAMFVVLIVWWSSG